MNHFFFENTDKHLKLSFDEISDASMNSLFKKGYRLITVEDSDFSNTYAVSIEKTNIGMSGVCFLDGKSSYQAGFNDGGSLTIRQVVNSIANGKVA